MTIDEALIILAATVVAVGLALCAFAARPAGTRISR